MNDPTLSLPDPYAALQDAILQMLLQYQGIFAPIGIRLFAAFATILLCWFGIETALGASERHGAVPMAAFARLLLVLSIGYSLVTYYQTPIPGIGYTVPQLITKQVAALVGQLHTAAATDLIRAIDQGWTNTQRPGLLDIAGGIIYACLGCLCGLMKFAVFFVISFGFIMGAIFIVLGPLFIPFFVTPTLDFLFWNWLRAFLTVAFYQVIAETYMNVWASFLLRVLEPFRAGFTVPFLITLFTFLIMLFASFIVGMLKIPSVTASLFAGRAGEGTAGATLSAGLAASRFL